MEKIYFGQIVNCKSLNELELIPNGFIAVENGKIIDKGEKNDEILEKYSNFHVCELNENEFILPGFIDCHIHAAQMPNAGLGLDMELLDWLHHYTFPLEAQFKDEEFSKEVYEKVVKNTLRVGTTCACYFATNHKESSAILADEAIKQGQRAFVGKVSSNCSSPEYYVENTEQSLQDNIDFIDYVLSKGSDLVQPIITPRFALSCDYRLQVELAKLAKKYDLNIQSHISENIGEIQSVRVFYPHIKSYAGVYEETKILTNKCIMAHGTHLEDKELEIFNRCGASIAHCPASNFNLRSGLCDVKRLLNAGIKVGLGTDVSGGENVSMLGAIRSALNVSQSLEFVKTQDIKGSGKIMDPNNENKNYTSLNYKQVLYLATLGGAEALSISNKTGNFEIGKEFDAIIVNTERIPIEQYKYPDEYLKNETDCDRLRKQLEKFLYTGDDRNIDQVFVKGRQVK